MPAEHERLRKVLERRASRAPAPRIKLQPTRSKTVRIEPDHPSPGIWAATLHETLRTCDLASPTGCSTSSRTSPIMSGMRHFRRALPTRRWLRSPASGHAMRRRPCSPCKWSRRTAQRWSSGAGRCSARPAQSPGRRQSGREAGANLHRAGVGLAALSRQRAAGSR